MKTKVLSLATIISFAAIQAFAAAHAVAVEDTDGNGSYSMEEMKVAYPELTEEAFTAADADESGDISADELTAAQEDGGALAAH